MPDNNFINACDFTFESFPHPLHPDEVGDSGEMELATSKTKPSEQAVDAYVSIIRRFSEFDIAILDEAYCSLEKQYPKALIHYYDECIHIRKKICQRFLDEINGGVKHGG